MASPGRNNRLTVLSLQGPWGSKDLPSRDPSPRLVPEIGTPLSEFQPRICKIFTQETKQVVLLTSRWRRDY